MVIYVSALVYDRLTRGLCSDNLREEHGSLQSLVTKVFDEPNVCRVAHVARSDSQRIQVGVRGILTLAIDAHGPINVDGVRLLKWMRTRASKALSGMGLFGRMFKSSVCGAAASDSVVLVSGPN